MNDKELQQLLDDTAEHVGIELDYVFDMTEMNDYLERFGVGLDRILGFDFSRQ